MLNSFCTYGNNNYDVSMSNNRRVPWGQATFCGGYYLLVDRHACATSCTAYKLYLSDI